MGLLRIVTAGSVDDGKSTLIGRMLYDAGALYEDIRASVDAREVDLANLIDGLRDEREQGITIDVAWRYFASARRSFIIADAPGHVEYTRNMVTACTRADACIVLVDASQGVLEQTRRHTAIAGLVRVPRLVLAINKMDRVGYSEEVFRAVRRDLQPWLDRFAFEGIEWVPLSALQGDNVVRGSDAMPWYDGPSLLELLEALPRDVDEAHGALRMPVQLALRGGERGRRVAGYLASGALRVGDPIVALPSGRASTVTAIYLGTRTLDHAAAPSSVAIELADRIDVAAGDLVCAPEAQAQVGDDLEVDVVGLDAAGIQVGRTYLMRRAVGLTRVRVASIVDRFDVSTGERHTADALGLNDIGRVALRCAEPVWADRYEAQRETGSFILIDADTHATIAGGMVRHVARTSLSTSDSPAISRLQREHRRGHRGLIVWSDDPGHRDALRDLESALFAEGLDTARVEIDDAVIAEHVASALLDAGLVALIGATTQPPAAWAQDDVLHVGATRDDLAATVVSRVRGPA